MRTGAWQEILPDIVDLPVTGMTADSRFVKSGMVFVAYKGANADGRHFIQEAALKGASLILYEKDGFSVESFLNKSQSHFVAVEHLKQKVSGLASALYDHPSHSMKVIGTTGTNGKTTITHLIAGALTKLGEKTGFLGTIGNGIYPHLKPSELTTADAIQLQEQLAAFKTQGVTHVAMEVSSHALHQYRTDAIAFHSAVFTNLTLDHLDYHGDFESYAKAKSRLFCELNVRHAAINVDDPVGKRFAQMAKPMVRTYGIHDALADLHIQDMHFSEKGMQLLLSYDGQQYKANTALLGSFNAYNFMAALQVLLFLDVPLQDALHALEQMPPPKGRMQAITIEGRPQVIVDYSHTPDALKNALESVKQHARGAVWCVFGCGGNRDTQKRPIMAQVAEEFADRVIVTDDNPRQEDPKTITDEIMSGFIKPEAVRLFHDRKEAIRYAVSNASENDIILIAGKGHENYQIIGSQKYPFDDFACATTFLEM